MVMVLAMLCGFLPAFNIIAEKQSGNIEQINVSPLPKSLFILSKIIPYWIMGLFVLSLCFFARIFGVWLCFKGRICQHLRLCACVYPCGNRAWTCYFKLFCDNAASYVCELFFHTHFTAFKWAFHFGKINAILGANFNLRQPFALFYRKFAGYFFAWRKSF